MPLLSQTFSLNVPSRPPPEAYRIAHEWLVSIGAKDIWEAPPTGLAAVFGTGFTFGWKRNAKKALKLQFQPVNGGTTIHLRIELTAAHADEAAMFAGRIIAGWQEFANELWRLYGGGTALAPPSGVPVLRDMNPAVRASAIGVGVLLILVALSLPLMGIRGILLSTLIGGLVGGGAALLIVGIIGKERAVRR